MKRDLVIPVGLKVQIVQVKNDVLVSNLLQLKEIEKYHQRHPTLNMNDAAVKWIGKNSAQWRRKHISLGGIA